MTRPAAVVKFKLEAAGDSEVAVLVFWFCAFLAPNPKRTAPMLPRATAMCSQARNVRSFAKITLTSGDVILVAIR